MEKVLKNWRNHRFRIFVSLHGSQKFRVKLDATALNFLPESKNLVPNSPLGEKSSSKLDATMPITDRQFSLPYTGSENFSNFHSEKLINEDHSWV